MMFAQRVHPDELIDLLAAESYDPVLMKFCGYTKNSPKLSDFITDKARLGVTGTIANAYVPEGTAAAIPYLTTKQVDGLYAHLDGCKYITADADQEWSHCRVPDGAIVLNKSGNVGAAAIVACAPYAYVNTVSDLINIRPRQPGTDGGDRAIDSGYLVVFLNSPYGQSQLQRLSGGAVFDHVSLLAVPEIRIHAPSPLAQRYIGDKVRQAERLRDRARLLEAESSTFFQLPEWTEPRAGMRRAYTARRVAMRSERLDSPFYDPGHEDLDALLRRRGSTELSEVASLVEARWTRGGEKFSYFEIGELDIESGILSPTTTEVAAAPSRAQIRVEPWDVLVSTVRPNRKNVGLVLPSDESLALVASTGFAVLRFKDAETAAFYHSFLRSDAATQQLMRWNSGATYPAIESDVPLRVRTSCFDDEVVKREGRRWLTKFSALVASRGLTVVAANLVEHLIDGRLEESDLIAAQRALEGGDRSADREILKSLRQSDAPDAKPLIADVDALYTLVDGSEGRDP
jgi:type I restriction enzyme S subunit